MVLATMETRHFEFTTIGSDEEHARNLMNQMFAKHLVECGLEWTEQEEPADFFEANFIEVKVGSQLRDGEPINGFKWDGKELTQA